MNSFHSNNTSKKPEKNTENWKISIENSPFIPVNESKIKTEDLLKHLDENAKRFPRMKVEDVNID